MKRAIYPFMLSCALILGHHAGHGMCDVLLNNYGIVIRPVHRTERSGRCNSHRIDDGLDPQLSDLNRALLHGTDKAILKRQLQQTCVKDKPPLPEL